MRIVVDVLLLLPALLYQTTLAANLEVRGVGVDLIAVVLASLALTQGWLYGAVGGLAVGLILDCVFGQMGFYALQYMALGMLVGLAGFRFRLDRYVLPALALLAAYVVKEMVPVVYLYFARAQVGWGYAFLKILACGLLNAAVLVPVYALIRRLHRWDVISAPIFRFHGKKW